jgi:hypothetical protein
MVSSLTEGIVHLLMLALPEVNDILQLFDFFSQISSLLLVVVSASPVIVRMPPALLQLLL